jgi:hypothetical protein
MTYLLELIADIIEDREKPDRNESNTIIEVDCE